MAPYYMLYIGHAAVRMGVFMAVMVFVIISVVVVVIMFVIVVMFVIVAMFVIVVIFVIMVMMVMMKEYLFSLFDTVDLYAHVGARYPAFYGRGGFEYDPGYADSVYLIDEFRLFFLAQKLEESGCEHVSCGAHAAVYI